MRRRARPKAVPASAPDLMPVSARVAWTYLAVVLALFGTGLVAVFANQVLAVALCPVTEADTTGDLRLTCQLGVAVWSAIGGFLVCLVPALRLLKLDWWLWLAAFSGAGYLVAADASTEWWWWLCAALVPALAALATAEWPLGSRFRRWQLGALLILAAGAVGALLWWYLNG